MAIDRFQSEDLLDNTAVQSRGVISEFLNSAAYGATAAPLRGVAQIIDHKAGSSLDATVKSGFESIGVKAPEPAKFNTSEWYAQQLGGAVGLTVPFLALRGGIKAGAGAALGESVAMKSALDVGVSHSLGRLAMQEAVLSGSAGFVYGSVFNPSKESNVGTDAFLQDRAKRGLSDMAIFGTLALTSPFISRGLSSAAGAIEKSTTLPLLKDSVAATLRGPLLPGALSGIPAGGVAAEMAALKDGRWLPNGQELKENVVGMVVVGGTLGTAHWLGAQRPGTNSTNARHYADKLGLTEPANSSRADFKIVSGADQLAQMQKDIAAGAKEAQAQLMVRPKLDTVIGALSNNLFSFKYGDVRPILLDHRADSVIPTSAAGKNGLIATCSPLDAVLAARDVFQGRAGSLAERTVWLSQPSANHFSLRLGPERSSSSTSSMPSGRLAELALGSEAEGVKPAEPASEAKVETELVETKNLTEADPKLAAAEAAKPQEFRRRETEQFEKPRPDLQFGEGLFRVFGKMLNRPGHSTLVALNKNGERGDLVHNDTVAKFGVDKVGQPYVQINHGQELWTLNGKPVEPRFPYSIGPNDTLVFNGKTNFEIASKTTPSGKQALDINVIDEAPPTASYVPREITSIATPEQIQRVMGKYAERLKEAQAAKAREEAEAAVEAAARAERERAEAENGSLPAPEGKEAETGSAKPEGSEVLPSGSEPSAGAAPTAAERTSSEPGGASVDPAVESLLKSPLEQILKPIVLTDEAAVNAAARVDGEGTARDAVPAVEAAREVKPAVEKAEPVVLTPESKVMVNGKELATGVEFRVGRFPGIDIQITRDASVGKVHGYIGRTAEGKLYFRDTSSSGTTVNGKVIDGDVNIEINVGDTVVLGNGRTTLDLKAIQGE